MVNLVVSCSNRKTAVASARLRLSTVRDGSIEDRAEEWLRRLERERSITVPARRLYCGDHWSVACSVSDAGQGDIRTWVASAGYGLIPIDAPLKSYGATFDVRHADSVVPARCRETAADSATSWWARLARWSGPTVGAPRTLADVARESPNRALLVVGSPPYVQAMKGDLQHAAAALADPDLLSLFSAGTATLDGLVDHHIPCDARMQSLVGGARQSLNIRVARLAIEKVPATSLRASQLQGRMRALALEQPEVPDLDRSPATDDEVRAFLRDAIRKSPKAKHSPLLRVFRDGGRACEQSRFAALFREVYAEVYGQAAK